MRRHLTRFGGDERGAALVEFTILLPFLILLFVIVVDIGHVLREHHVASQGVRDAARYLARVPDPTSAAAQTVARNLALTASLDGTRALRSSTWTAPASVTVNVANVANGGQLRGPATIRVITVQANRTLAVPAVGPVLRLFGGDAEATLSFSVVDQTRHYGG